MGRLNDIIQSIDEAGKKDTNLIFINAYFNALSGKDIELIQLTKWVNCNTVSDYRRAGGDGDE